MTHTTPTPTPLPRNAVRWWSSVRAPRVSLGNILRAASVDCVILDTETRRFIEQRPRAGFVEEWAVRGLEQRGLAKNLTERAPRHTACEFRFEDRSHHFDYTELTGHQPSSTRSPCW